MKRRNTVQKIIVLDAIKEMQSHVSADEVYEYLSEKYTSISRGTVYRNLNLLSEEGKIQKIKTPYGADIFDFTLTEHYHIKCVICRKIFDVDMDIQRDIFNSIKNKHGFVFYRYNLFFEGLCPDCQKEQE